MTVAREGVIHDYRLRWIFQAFFNVVETKDAIDFCYIQSAIAKGDAIRRVESLREEIDFIGLIIAIAIHDCVDVACS